MTVFGTSNFKLKSSELYWSPRLLGILGIILFTIMSLDVFGEGYSFLELVVALGFHLLPAFVLIISLIIGWKYDLYGGMIFNLLAVFSIFFFDTTETLVSFLFITFPLLLIGELFFLNWYWNITNYHKNKKPDES